MNLTRFTLICILSGATTSCEKKADGPLPEKWHKDFSISASAGVGMKNESTVVQLTYDSCIYIHKEGSDITKNAISLSGVSRGAILKELKKFRVDQIHEKPDAAKPMLDEAVPTICFTNKSEYCLSGGSSSLTAEDFADFSGAYRFLMAIAAPPTPSNEK